ncbi:hypothetical protein JW887_01300 [Candidatus Dojkabacteria bacterium]|nr:hypothetical protein [Candidatus Dojkabacteria bacterium]
MKNLRTIAIVLLVLFIVFCSFILCAIATYLLCKQFIRKDSSETYFNENFDDFENAVDSIKASELDEYNMDDLFVSIDRSDDILVVVFSFSDKDDAKAFYDYRIYYIESNDMEDVVACSSDGYGKKLAENWYMCKYDMM